MGSSQICLHISTLKMTGPKEWQWEETLGMRLKWLRFRKFSQRNCIYLFSFFLFSLSHLVLGHNTDWRKKGRMDFSRRVDVTIFSVLLCPSPFLPLVVNTLCYSSGTWIWLTLGLRKGGILKFSIFKKGYFSMFYIYNFSFCHNKTDNIIIWKFVLEN